MEIVEELQKNGFVPVITLDDAGIALDLAQALLDGGLTVVEITLRTAAGLEALKIMSQAKGLNVGAGTVLTGSQAEDAIKAGAKFVMSPGFSAEVTKTCQEHGITYLPGVATARDIQDAFLAGCLLQKFFPAEANGGVKTLSALAAPFPQIRFVPTGGINVDNIGTYLNHPAIVACGGSWMISSSDLKSKNWQNITQSVKNCIEKINQLR